MSTQYVTQKVNQRFIIWYWWKYLSKSIWAVLSTNRCAMGLGQNRYKNVVGGNGKYIFVNYTIFFNLSFVSVNVLKINRFAYILSHIFYSESESIPLANIFFKLLQKLMTLTCNFWRSSMAVVGKLEKVRRILNSHGLAPGQMEAAL